MDRSAKLEADSVTGTLKLHSVHYPGTHTLEIHVRKRTCLCLACKRCDYGRCISLPFADQPTPIIMQPRGASVSRIESIFMDGDVEEEFSVHPSELVTAATSSRGAYISHDDASSIFVVPSKDKEEGIGPYEFYLAKCTKESFKLPEGCTDGYGMSHRKGARVIEAHYFDLEPHSLVQQGGWYVLNTAKKALIRAELVVYSGITLIRREMMEEDKYNKVRVKYMYKVPDIEYEQIMQAIALGPRAL